MGAVVAAKPQKKSKADAPSPAPPEGPQLVQAMSVPAGLPLFLGGRLQRKLAVGAADDPLEDEADRVADAVVSSGHSRAKPNARRPASGDFWRTQAGFGNLGIQRKCGCGGSAVGECEECRKKREELEGLPTIHRRTTGQGRSAGAAPPVVHDALRSGGRPLEAPVRSHMEGRFGRDFSGVRVHTDPLAAKSAKAINALAYTSGNDVVFGEGQYSPHGQAGQHLLAHELTHTLQQSGQIHRQPTNPALTPPPATADDPAMDDALEAQIAAAQADMDQDKDLLLRASGSRMALLLQFRAHPPLKEQADLDAFVAECETLARGEMETLNSFGGAGAELALMGFPKGFPLTWSGRVQAALTLGSDPATIVADWAKSFNELFKTAAALGPQVYATGLPVPFEDRGRLANFKLRIADAAADKPSAVGAYARQAVQYMQLKWLSVFAFSWEGFVNQIAEAVADGKVVVHYTDWDDFVKNKQAILRDLPARARDRLARSDEDAQQLQTDAVKLGDAALFVGMASGLYSLFGILSAWTEVSDLFDGALQVADKSVAASGGGERLVTAVQWAIENSYFGGAAAAWAQNLVDNGPKILAEMALILVLGMIPGVDIAVAVYLAATTARDVIGMIDELGASLNDCMQATSVGQLQEAAARLAQILTNGAILILIVLITEGVGKAAARVRGRAAELRAADQKLTQEAAEKAALKDLSAEERKALEETPAARLGKKFRDELEGACTLGSIICRSAIPKHVRDEAGAYPKTAHDVHEPSGPFNVQKSALSDVDRSPETLRAVVKANRKAFPDFDKALAKAEKAGKDWVYDSNGKAWEVHHVKPVSMGGGNDTGNLVPLPKSEHQVYSNYWNDVRRAFEKRFTKEEWDEIYWSEKNVPGSKVPKTPVR